MSVVRIFKYRGKQHTTLKSSLFIISLLLTLETPQDSSIIINFKRSKSNRVAIANKCETTQLLIRIGVKTFKTYLNEFN